MRCGEVGLVPASKYLWGPFMRDDDLATGRPNLKRGPVEQQTPDDGAPFEGGGRRADLPGGYQQRQSADADWRANLDRNARQDREAVGQPRALDGTPWVKGGSGRKAGI